MPAVEHTTHDWTTLMRTLNWQAAWEHCDRTLASRAGKPCWELPRHLQWIWDGSPLDDKIVLVRCYHGLGDTIQFIRFIPMLRRIAKKVIVWAQPKLMSLLQSLDGIDELLPLHDGTPEVDYDEDIELMELPHILRLSPHDITAAPYLSATPAAIPKGDKVLAGLVWRAGDWDERRSIPYQLLHPLFQLTTIDWYILQPGAIEAGWQEGDGTYRGEFTIDAYTRQIAALDILVTIDSMPAHLAGAMGIPVWTLLQAEADWRWLQDTTDSIWYSSMRLFRQPAAGDWTSVIQAVSNELQHLK